ncbi:MAG: DUF87 domain-containing protein, partial [Bacteroidota bacterium]
YDSPVELEPIFEEFQVKKEFKDDGKWNPFSFKKEKKEDPLNSSGVRLREIIDQKYFLIKVEDHELAFESFPFFIQSLLSSCELPVTWIQRTAKRGIEFVVSVSSKDQHTFQSLHSSILQGCEIIPESTNVISLNEGLKTGIVDFGLALPSMVPMDQSNQMVDQIASLIDQEKDARVEFRTSITTTLYPWARVLSEIFMSNDSSEGKTKNEPIQSFLEEKLSSPLYFVSPKLLIQAKSEEVIKRIYETISRVLSKQIHSSNYLIPLSNADFSLEDHYHHFQLNESYRTGCLLNLNELQCLTFLPSPQVRLRSLNTLSKTFPVKMQRTQGEIKIGVNIHQNQESEVFLSIEERLRHTHILGSTGSGKSTLLKLLIKADIEVGRGCTVIDPHGDLVRDTLGLIPKERIEDVVVIDPTDFDNPIGFNLLEANSEAEKIVLSSDLIEVFKSQATSWGDQMSTILHGAINVFLDREECGSLLELKFFLEDSDFRDDVLSDVKDHHLLHYWRNEFP